jgi:hypothetical protein
MGGVFLGTLPLSYDFSSDLNSLQNQMQNVAYQIANFDQLADQEAHQIIADAKSGGSTPAALQNDLDVLNNSPGDGSGMIMGFDAKLAQQGAYGNILNYAENQLSTEIQGEVANIFASNPSKAQLQQFRGILDMEWDKGSPNPAMVAVSKFAWDHAIGWITGKAADLVQGTINWLTPTPPSQMLYQQTQSQINQKIP